MSRWPGTYFDGETARPQRVEVEIGKGALGIYGRAGLLAKWEYQTLRRVPGTSREAGMIEVTSSFRSDERLRLDDQGAVKALRTAHPRVDKRPPANRPAIMRAFGWTGAAVGALAFIVFVAIPALAPQIAAMIPVEKQVSLGEQVESLISDVGLVGETCTTPEGSAALEKMTTQLTKGLDLRIPVRVSVVNSRIVNAVALPGGRVLLFFPLIEQAESVDEVAGVLGHEIGHVQMQHPLKGALRSSASAGVVGLFFGDFAGAGMMAGLSEQLVNASNTRDAEREADRFAVERMAAANASSAEMAKFFARMRKDVGDGGLFGGYMASHPSFSEREAMLTAASIGEGAEPILSKDEWEALRQICDHIDAPDEEEDTSNEGADAQ